MEALIYTVVICLAAGFAGGIVFTLYGLPKEIASVLAAEYHKLETEAKAVAHDVEVRTEKAVDALKGK